MFQNLGKIFGDETFFDYNLISELVYLFYQVYCLVKKKFNKNGYRKSLDLKEFNIFVNINNVRSYMLHLETMDNII